MVKFAEELEMFPIIEFMLYEDMNQHKEFEDANAILKRLMLFLLIFSGKNFKLWAIKMEGLLGSINLWHFYEVKFDDNYVSHDEWLNMMHEKHLIDQLLFVEKSCLPPYTNQMQDNMFAATELTKEVEDMN